MAINRKKSFRRRIFFTFFLSFSLFAVSILLFQYDREKKFRTAQLENTLDNFTQFLNNYIQTNDLIAQDNYTELDSVIKLLPIEHERVTLINNEGVVLYDSKVADVFAMENHIGRPEIQKSIYASKGSSIRTSETTQKTYYYYSVSFPNYFIRTAVIYDVEIKDFLKTERSFLFFIITVFIIVWFLIVQLTRRIGAFISQLRDFAVSAAFGEEIEKLPEFPDRELDVIGKKIVDIYNNLNNAKYKLELEKNKLFEHLNAVEEGIAIFSKKGELKLSNSNYVQCINLISDKATIGLSDITEIKAFDELLDFVKKQQKQINKGNSGFAAKDIVIAAGEQYFSAKTIVFRDKSFEIILSDITKLEKRRLLKQQLTSNIAHELKTPVTSMKGYLETIINNDQIPPEKRDHFIRRAFFQAERLTELLNDISLLNNIEDAGGLFEFGDLEINKMLDEVIDNRKYQLEEKNIETIIDLKDEVKIKGNEYLITSVFQNLIENTVKYAGEGIKIIIKEYHSDDKYFYFSYADTGAGIPEEHQQRIFERFYRIDEGRTREKGGTGLGLSIVKNAIQLHKGEISVRSRPEGGVEFLFTLLRK